MNLLSSRLRLCSFRKSSLMHVGSSGNFSMTCSAFEEKLSHFTKSSGSPVFNVFCVAACGHRPDLVMVTISIFLTSRAEGKSRNQFLRPSPFGVSVMRSLIAHSFHMLVFTMILASSSVALSPDGELSFTKFTVSKIFYAPLRVHFLDRGLKSSLECRIHPHILVEKNI